ncbi:hypothetical protein ABZ871_38475 [Streptomyces populi]
MTQEQRSPKTPEEGARSRTSMAHRPSGSETWSRRVPVRLAGYEDDPEDAHIVRGID